LCRGEVKTECTRTTVFHPRPFRTLADVEFATAGWVDRYDNRRVHGSLGMLAPVEFDTLRYEVLTREPAPTQQRENTGCFYVVSSRGGGVRDGVGNCECSEDLAADVALEAASDLSGCLALALAPLDVGAGGRIGAHPGEHDGVQRAVQPSVSTAVEAMPRGVTRGGRDRADSCDHGECGLVAYSAGVRPDRQDHGCGDCADSWQVQQLGSCGLHEVSDPFTVLGEVPLERRDLLREACRFGAGGCCPQRLFSATPAR